MFKKRLLRTATSRRGFLKSSGRIATASVIGAPLILGTSAFPAWGNGTLKPFGALLSHHGKYVSVQPDDTVCVNRGRPSEWESLGMERPHGGKVALRTWRGKYLCCEPDGTIIANRCELGPWETFSVEDVGEGRIALRSFHGTYLSAQPSGTLECNRPVADAWERFRWVDSELSVEVAGPEVRLYGHVHCFNTTEGGEDEVYWLITTTNQIQMGPYDINEDSDKERLDSVLVVSRVNPGHCATFSVALIEQDSGVPEAAKKALVGVTTVAGALLGGPEGASVGSAAGKTVAAVGDELNGGGDDVLGVWMFYVANVDGTLRMESYKAYRRLSKLGWATATKAGYQINDNDNFHGTVEFSLRNPPSFPRSAVSGPLAREASRTLWIRPNQRK